ncbi:exostosin family protein [Mucilaginibacter sp. 21P]|uniref:exostosin domain-containing protein n=1 Tax=Mucilaginibacter sp. 21P TaxID=2778902 RepID=UPI001C59A0E3|nr:exostosin family protein [Mucilaginibacter sp. 21P]QXV64847.1 exostosin family protein [Mucilaginibacter sp. 21P]
MMISQQTDSAWINVFITSAYTDDEPISSIFKYAALDKLKKYKVVKNADIADIILFVENSRHVADRFYKKLKQHHLVKKYPQKVFMYNPHDKPWLVLPGLYASMPKRFFNKNFIAASPYIENINPYIKHELGIAPKYLFTFVGSSNSPPRRKILRLQHPRGILQASLKNMFGDKDHRRDKIDYAELIGQSKFVLCPRGAGTSSFRIFETMQAGRVPVIISDDWVAPQGPVWKDFALFVAERDVFNIPLILEKAEHEWEERAALSRQAWENFFAPEIIFTYLLESIFRLPKTQSEITFSLKARHVIPYARYVFRVVFIQPLKALIAY